MASLLKVCGAVLLLVVICEASFINPNAPLLRKRSQAEAGPCEINVNCVGFNASCTYPNYCGKGLYCSSETHLCARTKANGANCADSTECKAVCINSTCADEVYKQVGEQCEGDCVEYAYCLCDIDSNCTCVAYPELGQNCTDHCGDGSLCQSGLCIEAFSLAVGAVCSETEDCKPGLYCNSSSHCTEGFKGSGNNCTDDAECHEEEECECPNHKASTVPVCIGPQTFTETEANIQKKWAKCAYDKKCQYAAYHKDGNVVVCPECKSEICDYVTWVFATEYKDLPMCSFGDFYIQLQDACASSSSRAWVPIVIGCVVGGVVLIVIIAVFIWKKRSGSSAEKQSLVHR